MNIKSINLDLVSYTYRTFIKRGHLSYISFIYYYTYLFYNMPTLSIITNLPKHKVPTDFLENASKVVSEILETPELVS